MLVIWDFDGTLADTWPWLAEQIVSGAGRLGYRQITRAQIEDLRKLDTLAVLERLEIPVDRLPRFAADLRRRAEADAASFHLFPGIPSLLRALHARGDALAVVSSNTEATVRTVLGNDIAALFADFACGIDVFGKAAAFAAIMRETGMGPEDTVAIGDETRDLQAAQGAGIRGLVVEWGFADAALLRASAPGRSAESIEQLLALIDERDAAAPSAPAETRP